MSRDEKFDGRKNEDVVETLRPVSYSRMVQQQRPAVVEPIQAKPRYLNQNFRYSQKKPSDNSRNSTATGGHGSGDKRSKPDRFVVDLDKILTGQEKRTTIMIRNVPSKFTQAILLKTVRAHRRNFNFLYIPMNNSTKCNLGYAFINFTSSPAVYEFYNQFQGYRWGRFNSKKECYLTFARVQGQKDLVDHFVRRNSSLPVPATSQPLIFDDDGQEIPWPAFAAANYTIPRVPTTVAPNNDLLHD